MGDIGKYFNKSEFACRDNCEFDDISQELVDKLDILREELGQPIRVLSGCRCKARNEFIGGAKNSAHLRGLASDITCGDLEDLLELAKNYFVRIGEGKTFIHVDIDKSLPQKSWRY